MRPCIPFPMLPVSHLVHSPSGGFCFSGAPERISESLRDSAEYEYILAIRPDPRFLRPCIERDVGGHGIAHLSGLGKDPDHSLIWIEHDSRPDAEFGHRSQHAFVLFAGMFVLYRPGQNPQSSLLPPGRPGSAPAPSHCRRPFWEGSPVPTSGKPGCSSELRFPSHPGQPCLRRAALLAGYTAKYLSCGI